MAADIELGFDRGAEGTGIFSPWTLKVKTGKADVKLESEDGERILFLKCKDSSFSLERSIAVNIHEYPYLMWDWKVLEFPVHGDVRRRNLNDQALQLLVLFENGKVISYIWDSNAPEGTVRDESIPWPINIPIKVIVVKSGFSDKAKWVRLDRDIYQDYVLLYHEKPPPVRGLRIQSNTQYTKDTAAGLVGDIIFSSTRL